MDSKKGFKNVLKSVFGRGKEPQAEQETTQEQILETEVVQEVSEPISKKESGRLPPMEGSLLKLWHIWAGQELHPSLSLTEALNVDQIHMDADQLEREVVRASVQLEQEAKKRFNRIEELEKQGESVKLDAQCSIYVSQDKMIAWAFLFPPVGEEGVFGAGEVGRAMQVCHVTHGINAQMLIQIMQKKPYFELIPIAIGTPVVQGSDGVIQEHYEENLPFEVKIDENGVADYKASNYVRQIMKGDVICDITPPVQGTEGMQVDGKVAKPKSIRELKIPQGKNTELTEDGLQLIASIDGNLEYRNRVFEISPVLVIPGDVDYEIGNINFNGDVRIKGDVRENFTVTATGAIIVDGLVEAANIDAGGDLLITRGVVGDNRAFLRSQGCIRVKFLENCVAYAKESVYADCIMNSEIYSDNSINVRSGRGSVIGGSLTAAERIYARMIGAQSGRRTELTLGVLSFEKSGMPSGGEAANAAQVHEEEMDAQDAPENMVLDLQRCRLECDIIYPITVLTMRNYTWTARDVKRQCRLLYDVDNEKIKEVY